MPTVQTMIVIAALCVALAALGRAAWRSLRSGGDCGGCGTRASRSTARPVVPLTIGATTPPGGRTP
ncbi:MAG: FeoB-associated Cys-rich membrane protein [Phycisphaerae bacterium]